MAFLQTNYTQTRLILNCQNRSSDKISAWHFKWTHRNFAFIYYFSPTWSHLQFITPCNFKLFQSFAFSFPMEKIQFHWNWMCMAFTTEYENRLVTYTGNLALVPAIACFKQLKDLKIFGCKKLTNECFINGIVRNNTLDLEKIQIHFCTNITEEMFMVAVVVLAMVEKRCCGCWWRCCYQLMTHKCNTSN